MADTREIAQRQMRNAKPAFQSLMWGIKNNTGGIWSHETFFTEAEATKYLREHPLNKQCDLFRHEIVPVNVTINFSK